MLCTVGVPYHIRVTTGNKTNAGTNANVYIIMYSKDDNDREMNSGKIQLDNKKRNFVRGRTDLFDVECMEGLCPLSKIVVGHDDKGIGAGWYLEKVKEYSHCTNCLVSIITSIKVLFHVLDYMCNVPCTYMLNQENCSLQLSTKTLLTQA